jgi:hypothetical protein
VREGGSADTTVVEWISCCHQGITTEETPDRRTLRMEEILRVVVENLELLETISRKSTS